MFRNCLALCALAAGAVLAGPAGAHHAFNMYDNTKYVKLTGTVKSYRWANPHTMIDFVVTGPGGAMQDWTAECSPINMIGRHGWTAESLKPGDKAEFVIHPNREGVQYGLLVTVTKPDGAILHDKD
jgi:hypothetical protein